MSDNVISLESRRRPSPKEIADWAEEFGVNILIMEEGLAAIRPATLIGPVEFRLRQTAVALGLLDPDADEFEGDELVSFRACAAHRAFQDRFNEHYRSQDNAVLITCALDRLYPNGGWDPVATELEVGRSEQYSAEAERVLELADHMAATYSLMVAVSEATRAPAEARVLKRFKRVETSYGYQFVPEPDDDPKSPSH
jgi:hypothetical protein